MIWRQGFEEIKKMTNPVLKTIYWVENSLYRIM